MLIKICDMLGLVCLSKDMFNKIKQEMSYLEMRGIVLKSSFENKIKEVEEIKILINDQTNLINHQAEWIKKKNEIISQVFLKNDQLQKQLQVNNLVCQSLVQLIDQLLEENFRLQNDIIILETKENG